MIKDFNKWIDTVLEKDFPPETVAVAFNLYEDTDNNWSVELVGTSIFDANDEDWVCDEVFDTRDNTFVWQQDTSWQEVLEEVTDILKKYLEEGKYADKLKMYQGVGAGFVDGDVWILYQNEQSKNEE
ncbi:MAG: hypothetical protein K2I03_12700 [Lachnospiraceae bacterium]|nr:hypothetical protein [Lachnospiraceae bacterium]MDE6251792.1 hypothetical protein [Lachnospiraceae bacterium]